MNKQSGHRRVERLTVPRHLRGLGRGAKMVQLLDLSLAGARIEHVERLPDWSDFPMDLPGALGGGQVRAEVIWSRVSGHRPVVEGRRRLAFQTGLTFPHSTTEEQAALTVALVRIAGEWALGMLRELRRQAEQDRAPQGRFDVLCSETLAWLRREIEALRFEKSQ
jgi:hypothetical protein